MYGTIARLRIEPGAVESVREWARMEGQPPDGFVASYAFQMDGDPNEVWAVAVFRDRESYHANADSPEMDASYRKLRAFLTEDPEWHDGEIIYPAS